MYPLINLRAKLTSQFAGRGGQLCLELVWTSFLARLPSMFYKILQKPQYRFVLIFSDMILTLCISKYFCHGSFFTVEYGWILFLRCFGPPWRRIGKRIEEDGETFAQQGGTRGWEKIKRYILVPSQCYHYLLQQLSFFPWASFVLVWIFRWLKNVVRI